MRVCLCVHGLCRTTTVLAPITRRSLATGRTSRARSGFVGLAFGHIKRYLREYRYCITEASLPMWIDNAILSLPDMTPYMRHCGY